MNRLALTFSCQRYGEGALQKSLLTEALSIKCNSPEHWVIIGTVGIPGMLFYVVVVPTFIALVLIRERRNFTLYPSQKNYQSKWTLRFGFMFAGYREGYEWWETVVLFRKCFFVLLAIFLKQYGAAPQVVAASLVLIVALSAQLQNSPYQDKEHDRIERIGIQACLLQLLVALLCNLMSATNNCTNSYESVASLGQTSSILLILIVFGSTFWFFSVTIRATIQSSQKTEGVIGCVARCCGDRCGKRVMDEEDDNNNQKKNNNKSKRDSYTIAALRMKASVHKALQIKAMNKATRVVPMPQRSDAHIYAAVKLQQNMRNALTKKLKEAKVKEADEVRQEAVSQVEHIRKKSAVARNKSIARIKTRQKIADARVQKRLHLRKQAKQTGALQNCKAFNMLTEQSIHHIIDLMQYEKVENGTSICMQGEAADSMYLLMKGKVKIKINDKVVATLGKGKIFGERALFVSGDKDSIRSATVVAVEESEVLILTCKDFQHLITSGDLDEKCVEHLRHVGDEYVYK